MKGKSAVRTSITKTIQTEGCKSYVLAHRNSLPKKAGAGVVAHGFGPGFGPGVVMHGLTGAGVGGEVGAGVVMHGFTGVVAGFGPPVVSHGLVVEVEPPPQPQQASSAATPLTAQSSKVLLSSQPLP